MEELARDSFPHVFLTDCLSLKLATALGTAMKK
jgi:hypothetical protein